MIKRHFMLALICGAIWGCAETSPRNAQTPPQSESKPAQPQARIDFLKLIDRPRVDPAVQFQQQTTNNGVIQYHFSYAAEASQRVTGFLLKPANATGRLPVVIAMHGTGGSKNDELSLLRRLVPLGFIGVAIDGPYHGERRIPSTMQGLNSYEVAIYQAYQNQKEHPLYFDTVWDMMRLVDYLATRDDVDAAHIGSYGVSKGGIEVYLDAFADTRIAAAVPCIGVQTFQYGIDHNDWKGRVGTFQAAFDAIAKLENVPNPDSAFAKKLYERLMPGITNEFDGPSVLPLIAPRPLLVINSDNDNHTPIAGVHQAVDAAIAAYKKDGAEDRVSLIVQPRAGHQVLRTSETAAINFLDKWLKTPAAPH